MRKLLTRILVLPIVAVLSSCAPANVSDNAPIRVASYNIRYVGGDKGTVNDWNNRRDDLLSQVNSFRLDAFGLQEVDPEQIQYLRDNMPEFTFVGEHRNPDRVSGEASPVAFRKDRFNLETTKTFWLSETPDVPGSHSWGALCRRVCTYAVLSDKHTGKRFCFVNSHMDHRRAEANINGMKLILSRMKDFAADIPVVFTGDHNCREIHKAAIMATNVLNNALFVSECTPEGPWMTLSLFPRRENLVSCSDVMKISVQERNTKEGIKKYGHRIDYIYVSPNVRVLNYKTDSSLRPGLDFYPSDHFPLIATILL